MKMISQLEALKAIRKPMPPPTRIERPTKGKLGYRRRNKWQKQSGVDE